MPDPSRDSAISAAAAAAAAAAESTADECSVETSAIARTVSTPPSARDYADFSDTNVDDHSRIAIAHRISTSEASDAVDTSQECHASDNASPSEPSKRRNDRG